MTLFRRVAALCALFVVSLPAWAVSEKDLLPVDEAFGLTAQARDRDRVEISWKIAPGYYLYRHRTTVKADAGFAAEALQMPAGKKHHDDFFGEVETYRERLTAVLPGKADDGTDTVTLEVRYQGCADAGVCYPPQKRSIKVKLPAGSGAACGRGPTAPPAALGASPFNNPLAGNGGGLRLPGTANTQALPLPSERAFGFDAIVDDGNTVLLRFSPAPGYYLYRDRTSLKLEGAAGIRADKPAWPAAKSHRDEHFGDVAVYFDQVDVKLPLRRSRADADEATLVITFQGCQTDGICYPPMTRRVKLALPAGKVNARADEAAHQNDVIAPLPGKDKRAQARERDTAGMATQPMLIRPNETAATATDASSVPDASADNAQRTRPPGDDAAPTTLIGALLLALLGGLILNLMPCVLPILSLKVLGVAQSGESRQRARSHALWYTAGVLVAFAAIGALVLALRAAGQAAGWGFQLQHPWFIAALVYLMFTVGLSLSGVFTLGGSLGGVGQSLAARSGPVGDFFTGVLACVVASPCVAPVHGPAAGVCVHRQHRAGDSGVPGTGPGPGAAVPVDRLRPVAGQAPAAPGRLDGNAQARAGLPDVRHRDLAAVGAGQAAWRGCDDAGAGWPGGAGTGAVVVRTQPLAQPARGRAVGPAAAAGRAGAGVGRDPAGAAGQGRPRPPPTTWWPTRRRCSTACARTTAWCSST